MNYRRAVGFTDRMVIFSLRTESMRGFRRMKMIELFIGKLLFKPMLVRVTALLLLCVIRKTSLGIYS